MWINIFFLMFVAIIPFTTSMMVEYSNNHISIQVYCVNLIILGLLMLAQWEYASSNHRLVDKNLSNKDLKFISRVEYVTPILFLISATIAFFNIAIAKTSLYVLPLLFSLVFKTYKKV